MGQQKHGKLNWLQGHFPEGLLVDATWLQRHGYSSALRSKYIAHGWLDQVARGVYRRPSATLATEKNDSLRWQYAVISLQSLLERRLSVGGRTALELEGFAHYPADSGPREIHTYFDRPLPGWVSKLKLDTPLVFHNARKLFKSTEAPNGQSLRARDLSDGAATGLDSVHNGFLCQTWGHWEWPLLMSTPERAILELLDEVPNRETFHQADVLMEGLSNLSPRRLHALLVDCRSVKVKRLFLWFATRHEHAWLNKLDRTGIDLGSGKRMIVRGGKLDTRFNITVPENLDANR
jgi:hypothetical protein